MAGNGAASPYRVVQLEGMVTREELLDESEYRWGGERGGEGMRRRICGLDRAWRGEGSTEAAQEDVGQLWKWKIGLCRDSILK